MPDIFVCSRSPELSLSYLFVLFRFFSFMYERLYVCSQHLAYLFRPTGVIDKRLNDGQAVTRIIETKNRCGDMQNTLNNAFVHIRLGTVSCAGHAASLGGLLINCDGLFYGRTESVSS